MSTENENQNQEEQKKQDANKEAKKFDANWKKVVALLSGEALFKPAKMDSRSIAAALAELVKEEKEEIIKKFKAEVNALVKKNTEYIKSVKEEQAKADKAIIEKKKEMNKEMERLFAMVDKIQNIERDYYESLRGISVQASAETPAATAGEEEQKTD